MMFEKSTADARPEDKIHPCVAGNRCRGGVEVDGQRRPQFTTQPGTLCDTCTTVYSKAIKRLPNDYAMLAVTMRDRRARTGEMVHSSASPTILLDQTSDRLMSEIVEWADFAADLVTNTLNIDRPSDRRKLPKINLDGKDAEARPGTIAANSLEKVEPTQAQRLDTYLATVTPNLNALSAAPKQDVQIWAQPQRCTEHSERIIEAKRILELARSIKDTAEIAEALTQLQAVYAEAGVCNDCCGWSQDGRRQARQDVELSGLDVLNRLTRLHHLTRKHLGHTKLRHYYPMPCPRCGSPVGRDDGTTILNCENNECTKRGPSAWTEREYEYLTHVLTDDELILATTKYLLAEAYARLDALQQKVDDLDSDERFNQSEAVTLILGALKPHLSGHVTPKDRQIATDKSAAQYRQASDDNWAWKRSEPYKKPRKPNRRPRPTETAYATSSLSTLTDITIDGNTQVCGTCRLTKPCDCDQ